MASRTSYQKWSKGLEEGLFLARQPPVSRVGRNPLDEWSARRKDLYLTTHNRKTTMPPVEFEPMISVGERPQTYALDRAATGNGLDTGKHCK
jgi:hypothetical protein